MWVCPAGGEEDTPAFTSGAVGEGEGRSPHPKASAMNAQPHVPMALLKKMWRAFDICPSRRNHHGVPVPVNNGRAELRKTVGRG